MTPRLRAIAYPSDILVGDLVLLECLQGAVMPPMPRELKPRCARFALCRCSTMRWLAEGARRYRALRAPGATPRKTIDVTIATFTLSHGHMLLQQDRDFASWAAEFGLQLA